MCRPFVFKFRSRRDFDALPAAPFAGICGVRHRFRSAVSAAQRPADKVDKQGALPTIHNKPILPREFFASVSPAEAGVQEVGM